ncbi:hypothetical protein FSARC_14240 [Fusarium sarcochroum]|uniref:Small s protein n=1 Tax=Fusarium sarcochroum TaxID=1208366 RepID=A0A8H4SUT9_9HYPO|nr:hypothetical protein FSARC_14240 [Fusarium sarcochroum]
MSGPEVLAAVGILCNAMQIITFGRDALQVYRHMRDGGAPDPKLVAYLDKATASYKEMNEQSGKPLPLTHDQQQVVEIGKEGYQSLQEFNRKFDKLYVDEKSRGGIRGKFRIAKSGIRALWREKDLENLEKNFQRHEQLLQTRLIHRICSQTDAAELLSHESFRHLDGVRQHMVTQLAKGHTDLSDLILEQSTEIKDHVAEQHVATRTHMVNHLVATERNLQSRISESDFQVQLQKQHEQMLASFRYPDMNSRKNQISENYPETFKWIFGANNSSNTTAYSSSDSRSFDENHEDDEGNEQDNDSHGAHSDASSSTEYSAEPPAFATWLRSESKMFWISGKPASGKSTLMKFVASSPLTKESLESWRSDAQILVHCFWKAGHEMQQNIKGMVLSLIHQILLDRPDLTGQLWEEKSFVRQRWTHSDWAPQELDGILHWSLQTAQKAFCIFIDGLDEASEFERLIGLPKNNLTVLDKMMNLDEVKICISSREEDVFCGYFEGVKRLRIHELTENDIRCFAKHQLQDLTFASKGDRSLLLRCVVDRAEGVFLWVARVLDSVTRGFRLNNDIQSLIQRVEHTPADLKRLFQDMWERSGDDGDIYRVVASRYFNLAMVARHLASSQDGLDSMIAFAIASEDRTLDSMLDVDREVNEMMLHARCKVVERELKVVCHGLLDVIESEDGYRPFKKGPECLTPYSKKRIQFIHRSAADFFSDTVTGSDLLGACGWSHDETAARLLATILIRGRFSPYVDPSQHDFIIMRREKSYALRFVPQSCLKIVFGRIFRNFLVAGPCRDLMIETMRQWQNGQMFRDHILWNYPGHPKFSTNPLELEFLESATYGGDVPFVRRLLFDKPVETFLDAIPVFVRGLSFRAYKLSRFNDLMRFIINRLVRLDEEVDSSRAIQTQEVQKHLLHLLYSWYINEFLESSNKTILAIEDFLSTLEVLRLFIGAFPDTQDWNQPIALYISPYYGQLDIMSHELIFRLYWGFWCVVANYGTAYCIALDYIRTGLSDLEHECETPKGVTSLFKPILFVGSKDVYALRPDEEDRIGALLHRAVTMRSEVTEAETSLIEGCERLDDMKRDPKNVLSYLIDKLGYLEEFPIHPWTPGWIVQDRIFEGGGAST